MRPAFRHMCMVMVGVARRNPPGTVAGGGGASQRAKSCPGLTGPTRTTVGVVRLNSYICWRGDSGYRVSGLGRNCRLGSHGGHGRTEADGRLWIGIHCDGPVQLF